jgi:exodeoxyribonuclease-3
MRLVTWNINSVRLRAPLVHRLVNEIAPDVLCLQETKVIDGLFPHDALAELFPHRHVRGMKAYNGVAILSRIPFTATGGRDWCGRPDARHASVTFADGVELHDFYVPAGGDEPDPDINDKFAHKLQFLDEMTAWGDESSPANTKKILVGDLNIAPLEHDVWSHKQLLKVVSHTPVEIERLQALQASQDWVDAVRHFVPDTEKLFSWWSYRSSNWRESNRGRRLDHVWVTPALTKNLRSASVFDAARDWLKPSDHAPVVVDIDI